MVYVSAVPPSAEADALKAAFAQHGSVRSVHWRKDKGFAFVEFASARDAQSALAASNAEQVRARGPPRMRAWQDGGLGV